MGASNKPDQKPQKPDKPRPRDKTGERPHVRDRRQDEPLDEKSLERVMRDAPL